jgi:hypothetical protein
MWKYISELGRRQLNRLQKNAVQNELQELSNAHAELNQSGELCILSFYIHILLLKRGNSYQLFITAA